MGHAERADHRYDQADDRENVAKQKFSPHPRNIALSPQRFNRMVNSIDWLAFGDSIALGVAQAAGLPGNAVVGRMPDAVLAAIEGTNWRFVSGRSILLSSGLSNNPDGRSYVEQQIAALQTMDAARIVIIGVGPGVRAGTNEWLADLAKRSGPNVTFVGPLANTRPDGVHPYYDQLVDQINAVLAA